MNNDDCQCTIVMVARERFSLIPRVLETLFDHTGCPFRLIYVDAGSPERQRRYLASESRKRGFRYIRINHFLSPNQARNRGLCEVETRYVVFLDNDVLVAKGWLEPLLTCAVETGAAMVGPLVTQFRMRGYSNRYAFKKYIHCTGGDVGIEEGMDEGRTRRLLYKKVFQSGEPATAERRRLVRTRTRFVEFHCVLVDRRVLDAHGGLDEQMLAEEHIDVALGLNLKGQAIYFEPSSEVSFVPAPLLSWSDIPFYSLRWSDAWEYATYQYLKKKWSLAEGLYFTERYPRIGLRRREKLSRPICTVIRYKQCQAVVESLLNFLERRCLSPLLVHLDLRRYPDRLAILNGQVRSSYVQRRSDR